MQPAPFKKILQLVVPPFTGAAAIVWIYFVVTTLAGRYSVFLTGNLFDPDDYLYLAQAIDHLNGVAWFDVIQHRMDPPRGTIMPYSHLLSGFYALLIYPLRPVFGAINAALIVAMIVPPLYLAVFLYVLRRLAQITVDVKWGDMTAYFLLFSATILEQFTPGHIDHHGLETLNAVLAFLCMSMMVMRPEKIVWAALAGFILTFGLVIGLEILPVFFIFCLCIGAWAVVESGKAAFSGFIFGLSLPAGSFFFLLLTRSFAQMWDMDVIVYSVVYVILSSCICLCFTGVYATARRSMWLRYVIGAVLVCVTGFFFFYCFPALREGPYGGVDPLLVKMTYAIAPEAWPLMRPGAPWVDEILLLVWPVVAIAANIFLLLRAPNRMQRWLWAMTLPVLIITSALAAFYLCRLLQYTEPFVALILTAMVCYDWTHRPVSGSERVWRMARLSVVLLAGPVAALLHYDYDTHIFARMIGMVRVPEQIEAMGNDIDLGCDMHGLANILNDPKYYGDRPRVIINTVNEGSELLFRTPHAVLSAPMHTVTDGNIDTFRFFATGDAEAAHAIAEKRHADLVVICMLPSQLRVYRSMKGDIGTHSATFVDQLMAGEIPQWLVPVQSGQFGNLLLFEVH